MAEALELTEGEDVTLVGVVRKRFVVRPKNGTPPFARANLETDDGHSVNLIWWEEARAPQSGTRVSISGTVRSYRGNVEISVVQTRLKDAPLPSDRSARVIGFLRSCVEAEGADDLMMSVTAQKALILEEGEIPVFASNNIELPPSISAQDWGRKRSLGIGETLLCGFPVAVGPHPDSSVDRSYVSPLFIMEVRLETTSGRVAVRRVSETVDFNPFAFSLLGLSHDEQDELLAELEGAIEFNEASDARSQIISAVAVLNHLLPDHIAHQLSSVSLESLASFDRESGGVYGSAILFPSTGGSLATRKLIEDLDELSLKGPIASDSALGIFLGLGTPPTSPPPEPHPVAMSSSLQQDRAIHAALTSAFTVLTGPPGTGKSQVLVNLVSAAVAAGQTILFASKNNQAVDVVVERLKQVSPNATVIRAGASRWRAEVSQTIQEALDRSSTSTAQAPVRSDWEQSSERLRIVYASLFEEARLTSDLEHATQELSLISSQLPLHALERLRMEELNEAASSLDESTQAFAKGLGMFGRWKKHRARLERARSDFRRLRELLPSELADNVDEEQTFESVSASPSRSLAPNTCVQPHLRSVQGLSRALDLRAEILRSQESLKGLPPSWELDDELAALSEERLSNGRSVIDAAWVGVHSSNPAARMAASDLADQLRNASEGRAGARRSREVIPRALPFLPAWGVTNLSARTNFPLVPGLFDLVVIDEASQCDVASAIPLLFRAKRALIIGDRLQLIHVTNLGETREEVLGSKWALNDDDLREFSYRQRSCFSLAALRVTGEPLFLNLHFRSHPAIIGFSNEHFYSGRLEICSDNAVGDGPIISWRDVVAEPQRGPNGRSWCNTSEAELIVEELRQLISHGGRARPSIGVIAPYRAQVELIRELVVDRLGSSAEGVVVGTVHAFQGDERDDIILSTVVGSTSPTHQIRFVGNPNLVNVALTRARQRLLVVGNRQACINSNSAWSSFARYVSRLQSGPFDSPIELRLYEALLGNGIAVESGRQVGRYRIDLAYERNGLKLDVECDGAAFHTDKTKDAVRDKDLTAAGWSILRFSGRQITRDVDSCVARIEEVVAQQVLD